MNSRFFLRSLELVIEVQDLKEIDLNDEDIAGYFDLFFDNWEWHNDTYDN